MKLLKSIRKLFAARRVIVAYATEAELREAKVELAARCEDDELWAALDVMMTAKLLARVRDANGPDVPEAETKWMLGGASALAELKSEVGEVIGAAREARRG